MIWYDKQGKPILVKAPSDYGKIENLLSDKEYKIVKQELTPNKKYWVSTVWLGLDHDFSWHDFKKPNPKPLIFETMVFNGDRSRKDSWSEYATERYYTEAEALTGHKKMLAKWTRKEKK